MHVLLKIMGPLILVFFFCLFSGAESKTVLRVMWFNIFVLSMITLHSIAVSKKTIKMKRHMMKNNSYNYY